MKSGAEAVEYATNNQIDFVLMDIKMPGMNGIEAMRRIREVKPKLPIVAHTALAYQEEIHEFLSFGFNDYITKPVNLEELIAKLKNYI